VVARSAERRQMTLIFCDIVGWTAMADGHDPEETSDLPREYRETRASARWRGAAR
jgi:class 3 adenylate cyclase